MYPKRNGFGSLPRSRRVTDSAACAAEGMPLWQVPWITPYAWRIAAASPIA
jgi:hypothetical protein